MSDLILITDDVVNFNPGFAPATVVVQPGTLSGTGKAQIAHKKVCVDGDEKNVKVPGCAYMTPQYTIPGVGTLSIDALAADQRAETTQAGEKHVLLKGSTFTAKFEVTTPAQQPMPSAPPVPDPTPRYSGSGSFATANTNVKGA